MIGNKRMRLLTEQNLFLLKKLAFKKTRFFDKSITLKTFYTQNLILNRLMIFFIFRDFSEKSTNFDVNCIYF
jgi:hypothetical protein